MWSILCPDCGKPILKASIELHWNPPTTVAAEVITAYEHLDGTSCRVSPATDQGIDDILGELRRVEGLQICELMPEGESTRQAAERWAIRASGRGLRLTPPGPVGSPARRAATGQGRSANGSAAQGVPRAVP